MDYKHDKTIFEYIKQNPGTNMNRISEDLNISYPSVRVSISRLIETRVLSKNGQKLYIEAEKEYVKAPPVIEPERPRPLTPKAYTEHFNTFAELIGLGQALLKTQPSSRQIPTLQTYLEELQALFTDEDLEFYYKLLLIAQMSVGNLEFFSLFPTGPHPTKDRVEEIKDDFKKRATSRNIIELENKVKFEKSLVQSLEEKLRELKEELEKWKAAAKDDDVPFEVKQMKYDLPVEKKSAAQLANEKLQAKGDFARVQANEWQAKLERAAERDEIKRAYNEDL